MVDLTLTSVTDSLPKDVYVAVRVGESQKLGRLSQERQYRFPSNIVADHRFGKIDFFQKVASCTVGINPETDGNQEVEMSIDSGPLKFNVSLERPDKENIKVAPAEIGDKPAAKPLKEEKPKVKIAKKYLEHHNLEMRLKDAMQEVISAMPEDPAAFISERLATNNVVTRKPVEEGPPPEVPGEKVQVAQEPAAEAPTAKSAPVADALVDAPPPPADEPSAPAAPAAEATPAQPLAAAVELLDAPAPPAADVSLAQPPAEAPPALIPDEPSAPAPPADEALAAEAKAVKDDEEIRQQAKRTLLEATSSGKLDEALQGLRKSRVDEQAAAAPNMEELRQQMKLVLEEATSSGVLDGALGDIKKSKDEDAAAPSTEELRQLAKHAVLESGKLDEALANLKKPKEDAKSAAPATEQLRQQAKQRLMQASSSGKLGEALEKMQKARQNTQTQDSQGAEELPQQPSLQPSQVSEYEAPLEEFSAHGKQWRVYKTADGDLYYLDYANDHSQWDDPRTNGVIQADHAEQAADEAAAVSEAPPVSNASAQGVAEESPGPEAASSEQQATDAPLDTEELRTQVGEALLTSTSNGQLDAALAKLRPPTAAEIAAPPEAGAGTDAEATTTKEQPGITPCNTAVDADSLRRQAKKTLAEATASGKLEEALNKLAQKQSGDREEKPDIQKVRLAVKEVLLDAASSDKLDAALSKVTTRKASEVASEKTADVGEPANSAPRPELEDVRLQVKNSLLQATGSGALDAAIGKLNSTPPPPNPGTEEEAQAKTTPPPPSGDAKMQVKELLVNAAEKGHLEVALKQLKAAQPPTDRDTVKEQAKRTLLEANASGRLRDALCMVNDETPEDEHLRIQAKQILVEATRSGHLDDALRKLKEPKQEPSVEEARSGVAKALMDATAAGELEDTLARSRDKVTNDEQEAKSRAPPPDAEAIRKKAKEILVKAHGDGALDGALAKLSKPKPAAASTENQVEEIREQAKQTLLQAVESGALDDALSKMRSSAPPGAPDAPAPPAAQPPGAAPAAPPPSAQDGPPNVEEFRLQAKQTLLDATESGALDEALSKLNKPTADALEETRLKVQQVLVEASDNGALESEMKRLGSCAQAALSEATPAQVEEYIRSLDAENRAKLEYAVRSRPTSAVGQATEAPPAESQAVETLEDLRQNAQATLMNALADGRLEKALQELGLADELGESAPVEASAPLEAQAIEQQPLAAQESAPQQESVRLHVKKALFEAVSDGRLEKALLDMGLIGEPSAEAAEPPVAQTPAAESPVPPAGDVQPPAPPQPPPEQPAVDAQPPEPKDLPPEPTADDAQPPAPPPVDAQPTAPAGPPPVAPADDAQALDRAAAEADLKAQCRQEIDKADADGRLDAALEKVAPAPKDLPAEPPADDAQPPAPAQPPAEQPPVDAQPPAPKDLPPEPPADDAQPPAPPQSPPEQAAVDAQPPASKDLPPEPPADDAQPPAPAPVDAQPPAPAGPPPVAPAVDAQATSQIPPEREAVFNQMDLNKDAVVSLEEFNQAIDSGLLAQVAGNTGAAVAEAAGEGSSPAQETKIAASMEPPSEPGAVERTRPATPSKVPSLTKRPDLGGPPSPTAPVDVADLKAQIVDGLASSINESVSASVKDVVQGAFGELKEAMEKRDKQAAEMASQMSELSKTVSKIQAGMSSFSKAD